MDIPLFVAARVLATYLIPGCVRTGVRLGSENSSATATATGGVWKSGNLEIWDLGNLEIWGPGNPEILRFGDLEIQNLGSNKSKKYKISKFKSALPKMSARSGLVGKKSSRPYLGPSEAILSMDRKNPKNCKILPIFVYFPGVGPLLLSTRGGEIGSQPRLPSGVLESVRAASID